MVTLPSTLAAEAAREDLDAYRARPLKESVIAYLETKEFTPKFLGTLNRGQYYDRTRCIYDAKDDVVKLAELYGAEYKDDVDAIFFDNILYFFGKVPEEFAPGKTIGDLAQVFQAKAFDETLQKYLSQYWPKKDTFEKLLDSGYALSVPSNMELDMAKELERFKMTVEYYSQCRQQLLEESSMLNQYLRAQKDRELYLEGLTEAAPDTSRSVEESARREFFANLDDSQLALYFLSRKVDMMLKNANPFFISDDTDAIYSLKEMRELIKTVKDVEYESTTKNGETITKKMGPFNRILRFWDFYKEGIIDKSVLTYLTQVNDWILEQFVIAISQ